MARRRPIEEAPPAASSSEEEETDSEEEEETSNGTVQAQQNDAGEKQDDGEGCRKDDGGDEEDDDDEEEKEKPTRPPSEPSEPGSETDSEDAESTEPGSPSFSDIIIKPISPKRKAGPKLVQPKMEKGIDAKKGKRGAGAEGSHRLWSEEDEIGILNGISEYQNEKGKTAFADTGDLHGFVKDSLHVSVTNKQFGDKISELKKKYFTNVGKNENEIHEVFSKPHDLECVELAKKVLGAGGGIEVEKKGNSGRKSGKTVSSGGGGRVGGGIVLALQRKGNGEKGKVSAKKGKRGSSEKVDREGKERNLKKQRQGSNEETDRCEEGNVKVGKRGLGEEVKREGKGKKEKRTADEMLSEEGEKVNLSVKKQKELSVKKGNAVENEDFWYKYPYLRSSLDGENLPDYLKGSTMLMLGKVGEEKLIELETEWRSLMKVKLEFVVKQKLLIEKQIKLSLDVMESQDS